MSFHSMFFQSFSRAFPWIPIDFPVRFPWFSDVAHYFSMFCQCFASVFHVFSTIFPPKLEDTHQLRRGPTLLSRRWLPPEAAFRAKLPGLLVEAGPRLISGCGCWYWYGGIIIIIIVVIIIIIILLICVNWCWYWYFILILIIRKIINLIDQSRYIGTIVMYIVYSHNRSPQHHLFFWQLVEQKSND